MVGEGSLRSRSRLRNPSAPSAQAWHGTIRRVSTVRSIYLNVHQCRGHVEQIWKSKGKNLFFVLFFVHPPRGIVYIVSLCWYVI